MKLYKQISGEFEAKNDMYFVHASENDKIFMWIHPVMYGVRIQIATEREYETGYSMEYCAGSSQENVEELWAIVKTILEKYEEDWFLSNGLWSILPQESVRPNKPGMVVFEHLRSLVGEYEIESIPSISSMRLQSYAKSNLPPDLIKRLEMDNDL